MAYKPTRRQWIKLWVHEWLEGTTRFELNEAQRSVFIDLLALAGRSKFPGVIASGEYEDGYRGYPLAWIAGALVCEIETLEMAIAQCEKHGKVRTEVKNYDGRAHITIHICNWERYQSEYQRQRSYRYPAKAEVTKRVTAKLLVEGEGEGEKKETPSVSPPQRKQRPLKNNITPDFIEEMVVEFSARLGGEGRTRDCIEAALNHKAMDKARDKRIYLKGWLRRDAERVAGERDAKPARPPAGDRLPTADDFDRIARELGQRVRGLP